MQVFIANNYEELSKHAAGELATLMQLRKNSVVCAASGDTPAGLYRELVDKVKKLKLDVSNWHFVGLDEWVGMNGADEGSCRFHLDNGLLKPLKVKADKIIFFDGKVADLSNECIAIESAILQEGGIDVAILGLGLNGHVGMNEPGTTANSRTHVAEIDSTTQAIGQKYFKEEKKLTHGLTLGLATLMEAKNIMLLVSGSRKAQIVQKILEEEISEQLPASILRLHNNLSVYLDKNAAAQLQHK